MPDTFTVKLISLYNGNPVINLKVSDYGKNGRYLFHMLSDENSWVREMILFLKNPYNIIQIFFTNKEENVVEVILNNYIPHTMFTMKQFHKASKKLKPRNGWVIHISLLRVSKYLVKVNNKYGSDTIDENYDGKSTFHRCARCKNVWYCSEECQRFV